MVLQVNELCAVFVPRLSAILSSGTRTSGSSQLKLLLSAPELSQNHYSRHRPRDCNRRVDNMRDVFTMERSAVPILQNDRCEGKFCSDRIDNFMDEVGDIRESLEPLMPTAPEP